MTATSNSSSLVRPTFLAEPAIAQLALEVFGLKIRFVTEFESYDDRNYLVEELIDSSDSQSTSAQSDDVISTKFSPSRFVVKVLNSVDSKEPSKIGEWENTTF